ncbi:MAG: hypothetical protein KGH83_05865 [Thaumarchaeota archaeon]|nr:hypothetical protein [Nitrososphaerota archaeon]
MASFQYGKRLAETSLTSILSLAAWHAAAEAGQSISGVDMIKAAMGGGALGGFGGSIHGLSHLGSHFLKQTGSRHIANELRNERSQIANKFLDMAHDHGKNIGKKLYFQQRHFLSCRNGKILDLGGQKSKSNRYYKDKR